VCDSIAHALFVNSCETFSFCSNSYLDYVLVCRNSHAFEAGLSKDDIVLEVDGESVVERTSAEVELLIVQGKQEEEGQIEEKKEGITRVSAFYRPLAAHAPPTTPTNTYRIDGEAAEGCCVGLRPGHG
jgi:hypothetical protein